MNYYLLLFFKGTMTDYLVYDRITLNSSPHSNLVWTHGRKIMKYITDNNNSLQDISQKIKQRAVNEYGLKVKNGERIQRVGYKNYFIYSG